jgi:hypothetical protein
LHALIGGSNWLKPAASVAAWPRMERKPKSAVIRAGNGPRAGEAFVGFVIEAMSVDLAD